MIASITMRMGFTSSAQFAMGATGVIMVPIREVRPMRRSRMGDAVRFLHGGAAVVNDLGDLHTLLSLVGCEDGVSRSCRATCLGLLQTRCILVEDRLSSGCRDLRRAPEEDVTEGSEDLLTAQRVARHTGEDFGEGLPIEDAEGIGDTYPDG